MSSPQSCLKLVIWPDIQTNKQNKKKKKRKEKGVEEGRGHLENVRIYKEGRKNIL